MKSGVGSRVGGKSCLELKTTFVHGQAVTLTDAEEEKKIKFSNWTSSVLHVHVIVQLER